MADGSTAQALLARVVDRTPLRFAPGYANSGAPLEAIVLDDGTRLVVKRFAPATDLLMRVTGDRGRSATLFASGALDRLPPEFDHAVVAAAPEGDDGWVILMRDVGVALAAVDWGRPLLPAERRRVLAALAQMHADFAGEPLDGLCSPATWLACMTPPAMGQWRGDPSGLPDWALAGWDAFFAAAPPDVAGAVAAIHAAPAALGRELERHEPTLVHGDVCPGNVGLTAERVVLLDWALATRGPAALEAAAILAMPRGWVGAEPDDLLAEARAAEGARWDDRAAELALLAAFANYGWLLADRALTRPDAARRARERPNWDWWLRRVRRVLDTTWAP